MGLYFITGVRKGLGLEYVRQLSRSESNTIVGTVRNVSDEAGLQELRSVIDSPETKGKIHLVDCDVSSPDSVSSVASRLPSGLEGKFNVIIQNAAILQATCPGEDSFSVSAAALQSHFTTNVVGPAMLIQALQPHLAPGVKIVNITSGLGSKARVLDGRVPTAVPSYGISKAALNMLTVYQAQNLRGRAIVISVDPGHVKTNMGGDKAALEVHESGGSVLKVVEGLTDDDTGKFFYYDGQILDW
jgi:NAD(P)-dependent dehydrogenase (short-subunit alcohol dehydrogenase family)